jgi:hypothetical protein
MAFKPDETVYDRFTGEPFTVVSCDGCVAALRYSADGEIVYRIVGELFRQPSLIIIDTQNFNALIDQLWNGEISEPDFTRESLALGVEMPRINSALDDMRAEDGLLHTVEG